MLRIYNTIRTPHAHLIYLEKQDGTLSFRPYYDTYIEDMKQKEMDCCKKILYFVKYIFNFFFF